MSDQVNFDQRPDETAEAWLARLRTVSQDGMAMQLRFSYLHRKEGAERLVKQGQQPPAPSREEKPLPSAVLKSLKEAYRRLSREEQQQFAFWLSQGMPGD